MTLLDRQRQAIAILLAALAGYVDAVAFIASGGYFISFMSGNSTRLGVAIAGGQIVGTVALLILAFVAGVAGGTLMGHRLLGRRKRVMLLVAALLATAAASIGVVPVPITLALAAAAMGAENVVFADDGDAIGLTYMTGALVKIGQRLGEATLGGPAFAWLPFALLWAGLIAGGVGGGVAHGWIGLGAIWPAAALALLATAFVGEAAARPSPAPLPRL
jgi:uncharacterized membrane protein YoaK (UPF0700 family)